MKKAKEHIKLVVSVGSNGNYFVRQGVSMLGGFTNSENAEIFCDAYTNNFKYLGHTAEVVKTGFSCMLREETTVPKCTIQCTSCSEKTKKRK